MITTIIFDMDGVIIDSEPTHQKLEFEMYEELGLKISAEEHKNYVGTSSVDMWNMIREKHVLNKSSEELLMYGRAKYWEALDQDRVPLVDGAKELIMMFFEKKFTVQVASSATRPTVDKVIEHFHLEQYFSHRIGGDEVKRSKPDPEIFIKAARQSASDPTNCLVIEDSANGVTAAKNAGMHCIGYINPGTGAQNLNHADLVVNDLSKITIDVIASFS
jgi:HAD superfamily hydrolase (TIGR01549 family)